MRRRLLDDGVISFHSFLPFLICWLPIFMGRQLTKLCMVL